MSLLFALSLLFCPYKPCPPEVCTEPPQVVEIVETEEPEKLSAPAEYLATAYCGCSKCCGKSDRITATGTIAKEGRTIAVDPRKIPYGTELVIDGQRYIAEDCGGGIKGNRLDIYFEEHSDALEFGVRTVSVQIVEEK